MKITIRFSDVIFWVVTVVWFCFWLSQGHTPYQSIQLPATLLLSARLFRFLVRVFLLLFRPAQPAKDPPRPKERVAAPWQKGMSIFLVAIMVSTATAQCTGDADSNGSRNVSDLLIFNSVFGTPCPPVEEIAPACACILNDPCGNLLFYNSTAIHTGDGWTTLSDLVIVEGYTATWIFQGNIIGETWDLGPVADLPICIGAFEMRLVITNTVSGNQWRADLICQVLETCDPTTPPCPDAVTVSAEDVSLMQTPGYPQFEALYYLRKYYVAPE